MSDVISPLLSRNLSLAPIQALVILSDITKSKCQSMEQFIASAFHDIIHKASSHHTYAIEVFAQSAKIFSYH